MKRIKMKNLKKAKVPVIGGAGLTGSYTVEELLKEETGEIIICDNFSPLNCYRFEQGEIKD